MATFAAVHLFASERAAQGSEEPPIVGRPANFSGAVGTFAIRATAAANEVQAEDPLTLTLTISGAGAVGRPPQRPDLRKNTALAESFYVEDVPDDTPAESPRTWTFRYRLKPKNADVKAVPSLPFVYYTPGMLPPSRGYQTAYTEPIPLRVKPREAVQPSAVEGGRAAVEPPTSILAVPESSEIDIVGDPAAAWRPSGLLIMFLTLAPPLASAAAYLGWRLAHPGYEAASRRAQSRAAKRALGMLREGHDKPAGEIVGVFSEYLRERFELSSGEPTPSETATVLAKSHVNSDLAANVAAFYQAFDANRFARPSVNGEKRWLEEATHLIVALEADACKVHGS